MTIHYYSSSHLKGTLIYPSQACTNYYCKYIDDLSYLYCISTNCGTTRGRETILGISVTRMQILHFYVLLSLRGAVVYTR